jgi:hypothetical protein
MDIQYDFSSQTAIVTGGAKGDREGYRGTIRTIWR